MGVAEDFQKFRARYLIPQETISSISYRYRRITRQLNRDFWNTDSEVAHSQYVGSYGRDTAARGISDLDVAFRLPAEVYYTYNSYTSNGQSALLQTVKASIQKTYRTSESFGDGQVVVINFDDNIRFEILPVFDNRSGTWTYPDANSGGSWSITNPKSEIDAIHTRNQATNRNLKALCRMTRVWAGRCAVPMSGMLIDTLAYQFIGDWPYRDKSFLYHDYLVRDFMNYLSNQDLQQQHWRAPGSGSYVRSKGAFQYKARSSYFRSVEAIDYANAGRMWSSRQKWREIFGPLYPD
jgi:hypothetical protein